MNCNTMGSGGLIQVEAQAPALRLEIGEIVSALGYIKPDELRFSEAHVDAKGARARCAFRSVSYTHKPTSYLAVAEAAVVNVQLAQLHAWYLARFVPNLLGMPEYELTQTQAAHDVVYTNFQMRCDERVVGPEYGLAITLKRSFSRANGVFLKYAFEIDGGKHAGSYVGFVPR